MNREVKKPGRKILVIAITRLGDLLQASPTIQGWKMDDPRSTVTVLVDKGFSRICAGIPGIDEVYEIDLPMLCSCLDKGGPGIVDAYAYLDQILVDLRSRGFDFCINMSSSGYTALLMKLLQIPESRGWISDDQGMRLISSPWSMLFGASIFHNNRDYSSINIVDSMRSVAEVDRHPRSLSYTVTESGLNEAAVLLESMGLSGSGPLICIQAGASQEKRQWEHERFAQLSRLLIERLDARIVFTGTPNELPVVEGIWRYYRHSNMGCAIGKTSLESLAGLLKKADLLITGDTGPMHLAVAVCTPVVAIFLASAVCFETGPYSRGNIVVQPKIECWPCNPNYTCRRTDCHAQVSAELVAWLAELRLGCDSDQVENLTVDATKADPREIGVFRSDFDEDGFLTFIPINGIWMRKGQPEHWYYRAQAAYKQLWKEEFGVRTRLDVLPGSQELSREETKQLSTGGLLDLLDEGTMLARRLRDLVVDRTSEARLLGQTSGEIEEVDRRIEEYGLSHGALGLLVRMFVMEKENIRGEDPYLLTSETIGLYERTRLRSVRFLELYEHFARSIKGAGELRPTSGIRNDTAGKLPIICSSLG